MPVIYFPFKLIKMNTHGIVDVTLPKWTSLFAVK